MDISSFKPAKSPPLSPHYSPGLTSPSYSPEPINPAQPEMCPFPNFYTVPLLTALKDSPLASLQIIILDDLGFDSNFDILEVLELISRT